MNMLRVVVIITIFARDVSTYSLKDETKLHTELMKDYNVNVRPNALVEIRCGFALSNILYLNTVEQVFAVSGMLGVVWEDERLSWNGSEHSNVTETYFRTEEIWKPTIVLENSAVGIESIGDDSRTRNIPVRVSPSGNVFWLAPAFFVAFCDLDIAQFPFDTQTCEFKLSSWVFTNNVVTFVPLLDTVNTMSYTENGEFEITGTYSRIEKAFAHEGSYKDLLVSGIQIRRKYSYYLINIVLPVFLMQILGLFVFLVPPSSGEKLTFALTIFLALTVMMTLIAEKIPTTSLQIPVLGVYLLGGVIISGLEVVMAVLILRVKDSQEKKTKLGPCLQFLLKIFVILLCRTRNKVQSTKEVSSETDTGRVIVVTTAEDMVSCEKKSETVDSESISSKPTTMGDIDCMLDTVALIMFIFIKVILSMICCILIY